MKNDTDNRKKYAPPLRSKVRIGNTTFTVNSYFPDPATDTVGVEFVKTLFVDFLN